MSYIYEQAAYHLLNGEKLQVQLTQVLQIAEPQSAAIAHVWNEQREAYMVNLRERSFGTPLVSRTAARTPTAMMPTSIRLILVPHTYPPSLTPAASSSLLSFL